jgi:hypothetical protein
VLAAGQAWQQLQKQHHQQQLYQQQQDWQHRVLQVLGKVSAASSWQGQAAALGALRCLLSMKQLLWMEPQQLLQLV